MPFLFLSGKWLGSGIVFLVWQVCFLFFVFAVGKRWVIVSFPLSLLSPSFSLNSPQNL